MRKKYDWNALKTEFVTGDISAAALAKKHGINKATLYRHYELERWSDAKREYLESVMEKCADKAAYFAAIKLAREIDIAGKLEDILSEAVNDDKQFNRYLVKEKDSDGNAVTDERIFDKIDMKSLGDAIKALRSLEEIRRVMYGIASPAEERQFKIEEEKLKQKEQKECGVVMLPQIEE